MKIVQITDIHLRVDGRLSFGKMNTMEAFRQSVDYLSAMGEQPDAYVVTGDLADNGNPAAYAVVKAMLERLKKPIYIVPGNHDTREAFLGSFGEMCPVQSDIDPYICYTVEEFPVRLIMVETIDQGKHWGNLAPTVAKWLQDRLSEQPDKPTMVFTHHPPFTTGFTKMDEPFTNIDEFAKILQTHRNLTLCCGHIHRAITTSWRGIRVVTCPPIAMMMDMDFSPAGGDAFYLADPGFLMHTYNGECLNSIVGVVPTKADYSGPHPFAYLEGDKH